ncbi:MAG: hypothetical protein JXB13_04675, partial [Phycisphaerae bacterium]|nr:hypothetical protein [Phycisphaerae bacterium]
RNALTFPISGGAVYVDLDRCDDRTTAVLMEYGKDIFKIENNRPALALSEKDVAGKDSELIACEVECRHKANDAVFVHLPIRGLGE